LILDIFLNNGKRSPKRRRHDAQHKVSTIMAKNHGLIFVENLNVANMTRSARGTIENPGTNVCQKAGLNRSLQDSAFGTTRRMLEYKAPLFGGKVMAVSAPGSSRECCKCGNTEAENRKAEKFVCLKCGHAEHADLNAPKVILRRGLKLIPTGGLPGMACESSRKSGRKQEEKPRKRELGPLGREDVTRSSTIDLDPAASDFSKHARWMIHLFVKIIKSYRNDIAANA